MQANHSHDICDMKQESGFAVERAPATDSGLIDISLLDAALRRCRADAPKRVIICAFSAASNVHTLVGACRAFTAE